MKIRQEALAGSLESSDVLIRVSPSEVPGNHVEIDSLVMQQFGLAIEQLVRETLDTLQVDNARVLVDDKGALECVLRARLQVAIMRAAACEDMCWEVL